MSSAPLPITDMAQSRAVALFEAPHQLTDAVLDWPRPVSTQCLIH